MEAFIVKYWVEFLCAGVGAIVMALGKWFWKLAKKGHETTEEEKLDPLKENIETCQEEIEDAFGELEELEEEFVEAERRVEKEVDKLSKNIQEGFQQINDRLESQEVLRQASREGILYLFKKDFIAECKRLLEPEHSITFEELQHITKDHKSYNNLGGNSEGDELFKLVENKFQKHQ